MLRRLAKLIPPDGEAEESSRWPLPPELPDDPLLLVRLSFPTLPLPDDEAEDEAEELIEMMECGRLLVRLSASSMEPHTECRNLGAVKSCW